MASRFTEDDSKALVADVQKPDYSNGFVMHHAHITCTDLGKQLEFYTKVLGMTLIMHKEFPEPPHSRSVVYVGFVDPATLPADGGELWKTCFTTSGLIELVKFYEPIWMESKPGTGHWCLTVPDVNAACDKFKELGVEIAESPNTGAFQGLAAIKDSEGNTIELIPQCASGLAPDNLRAVDCCGVKLSSGQPEAPFILILKIRVPEATKDKYHALAKATDEGVMESEPAMLHHAWDQSPDEPDVFCWTEMYENSAAMLIHLANPKLGEFLQGHAEMSGEIVSFEIFGNVTDEVKEGLKNFPVKYWATSFGHTRQHPGDARSL